MGCLVLQDHVHAITGTCAPDQNGATLCHLVLVAKTTLLIELIVVEVACHFVHPVENYSVVVVEHTY